MSWLNVQPVSEKDHYDTVYQRSKVLLSSKLIALFPTILEGASFDLGQNLLFLSFPVRPQVALLLENC